MSFIKKKNEPFSSLTHLIAAILSIGAVTLLLVFSTIHATALHIVSFSIYGTSLIFLYTASTLYHFISEEKKAKKIFKKIDHSMIYLLIAGSYTPICLIALGGAWGWSLFGIVWGFAIIGILYKIYGPGSETKFSTALYLIMGWLIVIAIYPLLQNVSKPALAWLVSGGLFYSLGTIFFGLDIIRPSNKKFGYHEIWHLFVMAGSFSHFWFMFKYLI